MKKLIQRFQRAAWTYLQPLTRTPSFAGAPVSDLFLWRKGPDWQTTFELTDIASFYESNEIKTRSKTFILLFDSSGKQIGQQEFSPPLYHRQQIDISLMAQETEDSIGTFCVFHSHTPAGVKKLGSHLTERGYVGYRFRGAPLRAYMHGNLDAAALVEQEMILLAGSGPLCREYRLQHELLPGSCYDIAIVNPSPSGQKITCEVLGCIEGKKLQVLSARLAPGACHLFSFAPSQVSQRIVIRSRLVMARPVVFRIQGRMMDVFHG